uniref:Protein deacetylase HDAC6 n=1 Tax=Pseudonaja textilis TaxID=8673 RepID=A0A670YKD6_PSETE
MCPLLSFFSSFPECPERLVTIRDKLLQYELLERCVPVMVREGADEKKQESVDSQEYLTLMKSTETMSETELRSLADTFDSVYLHPNFYRCACLAAGSVLQLVEKVWSGELRNGLAVVRPPGHHAHCNKMNGYCMFNNVGIAAQYARQKLGVERVLIVDWDVHHGQGLQDLFEENPSILYFSIHRYEGGKFWPHLPESDSHAVGRGRGEGYNINVPWNQTGMRDADYLSAFLHVLLPVALEFQPHMVLVAAGFDAVIGDPKGEMAATPACFAHLTHLLKSLAGGKLVLSLEGGYNLQSLAEGTCMVLKTLLGDPCPLMESPESWLSLILGFLPFFCSQHPELPQRVSRIFQRHRELHLTERCCRLPARLATEEELQMCHSLAYVETLKSTATMKPRDLHRQGDQYNSVYICASSYQCARLAAGSAFSAVEAVLSGKTQNAVAIVRPPGHHAESDTACGFCFFNSVALAARYAQRLAQRRLRVMILDWDVHHGNGTQHIFEDDPSVLYISLHRYDNGTFFPTSEDADYDRVGVGPGEGFTLNVPWNCSRMGDSEYLAAFHQIIMPVSYEFNPELVLVSAGFDAARGDPLGGCLVTPECYAHMTHLLLGLAGGKVAVVLEGGYNLDSISESMTMCTRSLLGDPPPPLGRLKPPHLSALQSLARVTAVHRKYWASLRLEGEYFSFYRKDLLAVHQNNTCNLPLAVAPTSIPREANAIEALVKCIWGPCKMGIWHSLVQKEPRVDNKRKGGRPLGWMSGQKDSFVLSLQGLFYVVTPLPWCPHLSSVLPVPPVGLNVWEPCAECGSEMENWVCLVCYKVCCGRYINQHMLDHNKESGHPLVLSFSDLSAWCYDCQAYISHPVSCNSSSFSFSSSFSSSPN